MTSTNSDAYTSVRWWWWWWLSGAGCGSVVVVVVVLLLLLLVLLLLVLLLLLLLLLVVLVVVVVFAHKRDSIYMLPATDNRSGHRDSAEEQGLAIEADVALGEAGNPAGRPC